MTAMSPTTRGEVFAQATAAYRAALGGGELVEFSLGPLDTTGVPTWTAARFAEGEPPAMGFGYGSSEEEAILSALGETMETHGAARALPTLPRTRGSYEALAGEGAVDPVSLVLPAGSSYAPGSELDWVPARRLRGGGQVLLPVEAVATEPGELGPEAPPPLFTPITNGLGAGDTLERALVHGLLELVQRDGNSVSQRALDTGVAIDLAGFADPAWARLTEELGLALIAKRCETDLGMANVVVVGCERDVDSVPFPLVVTAGGEAAHPSRARAIRKALLEFCSSRSRKALAFEDLEAVAPHLPERYLRWARTADPGKDEPRALQAMLEWTALDARALRERIADPVLAVRDIVSLSTLPDHDVDDDPATLLPWVLERLEGFDPLWVDLSPPGGEAYVTKVIVPGLEVETASYGRIGRRNLRRLLDRGSDLVGLGAPPAGAAPILLPDQDGPAWLHLERLRATVRDLYALYREPGRHATWAARERATHPR